LISHAWKLAALFLSIAALLAGHGLQLSLLPLRADAIGWSSLEIGFSVSAYFGGFLLGCFSVPGIVRAVGHIRAFTVLAAIMTAALLGFSLVDEFLVWIVLRLSTGWSIAGLYLVIESWLNEEAHDEQRGAMLSLYTITVLVAMASGQLLLNLAPPTSYETVVVAALCVAFSAVPIGLTRIAQPSAVPTARFSPLLVLKTSRAAVAAAFVGGVVTGCFYGLGPVYGRQSGLDVAAVSFMMGAGILGGALFQWPLGRLSDAIDRRRVILGAMLAAAVVCTIGARAEAAYTTVLFLLFGGGVMPIYALSLAHAGDKIESSFLEVGTGILMFNAMGAAVGPVFAATSMSLWGAESFFVFSGVVLAAGALTMLVFIVKRPAPRPHFARFEVTTTASAQGAIELDPRSEEADGAA
jgi:MFS family permease